MRTLRESRRAGALVAATVAGVLCAAAPAAADVTVDPPSAPQGAGLDLTFHVTNDHRKADLTRVRLILPTDTPVAEVYPLSVDDWAPQMVIRELDTPLTGIHGGVPVTQTTAEIVWTAMPGRGIPPGGSADLAVSMGPLPASTQMRFTVQPTYADGSTVPGAPPVSLALTPATAAGATGHTGHDAGAETQPVGDPAGVPDQGPGLLSMAGCLVALLIAAAGGVVLLRARRGPDRAAGPRPAAAVASAKAVGVLPDTGAPARGPGLDRPKVGDDGPGGARTDSAERVRVTAWSYRDGP